MKNQNEKQVLIIVSIVALVAIGVMVMNVSTTFTGQATSALKLKTVSSSSCTDTDGGIDSYTLGKAGSYTDSCVDEDTVSEAYCDGKTAKTKNIDCKYNYCFDGECLTQSEAKAYEATICSDTDGGQDYFVGGTAAVGSTTASDYCLTATTEGYPAGYLYETYCSNNAVVHEIIDCKKHEALDCITTSGLGACRKIAGSTTGGGSSVGTGGSSGGVSGGSGSGASGGSLATD